MSTTTTNRSLQAHNKLIMDVIKRQAGSLDKAILEGTMNAIEAGASRVDIDLTVTGDKARLTIVDKGRGIKTKDEIIRFFETFGTPHDASEGKVWAQFRMGRGQLFSYGRNVWRTGTFQMVVDIDNKGLEWELTENLPEVVGCSIDIELYTNPIGGWYTIDRMRDSILQQVKFMSTPVFFNGKQVSIDPKSPKLNWTKEDEFAYYLFDTSDGLYVYNLGAFVKIGSSSEFGVAGIIVSKQQLTVNFARNDIKDSCPIYGHIKDVCYDNRIKQMRKASKWLQPHERIASLVDLQTGRQSYNDVKTFGLFDKSSGGKINLITLKAYKGYLTFAPKGDNVADKLTESNTCLCLDESVLRNVGFHDDPSEFFTWLSADLAHLDKMYIPFDIARQQLDESYAIISSTNWTMKERRIIKILQRSYAWGRNIVLGKSDTSRGWTDGQTFIAIDRTYLEKNDPIHAYGAAQIIGLMIHELAHDCNTSESHEHGEEFFRRFHDICRDRQGPLALISTFRSEIKKARIDEKVDKSARIAKAKAERRERKLGLVEKTEVATAAEAS